MALGATRGGAGAATGDARRWGVLALLCLATVLAMATWFSANAVAPQLAAAWGLPPEAASSLTLAVQAGFVVGAVGASLVALPDIVAPRRLIAGAALLAALSNAALLAAPGIGWAAAARFVTGVALAGVYPPMLKLVSTWFATRRGLAFGFVIGALTLGSASPHLVRAAGGLDAVAVVASSSLGAVAAALLVLFCAAEGPHPFPRAVLDPRQIGRVLRDPDVRLASLGYFGHMWELYAMWAWFLSYASAAEGGGASLLTFGVVAVGAVGCLAGGVLADRFGRIPVTVGMMAVSGACALLIGFAFDGPHWLFLLIAAIWGASVIGDSAQFSAVTTEVADSGLVGTALSLQMGLGFALTIVSISLVPHLVGWLGGWRWCFAVLAPGPALGIWAMSALGRRRAAAA